MMDTEPQIQEAQRRVSAKTNSTSKHIIIKLLQMRDKEKILKAARGKKDSFYIGEQR